MAHSVVDPGGYLKAHHSAGHCPAATWAELRGPALRLRESAATLRPGV